MNLPAFSIDKTKWKARSQTTQRVLVFLAVATILVVPSLFVYVKTTESKQILPATSMGNMYLSPEKSQAKQGETLTVSVRIEPGTPIDTVVAHLQFNPDQLSYTSVSYQNSPFATQIPIVTTGNRVTIESAKFGNGPVASDSLVAQLTFTAKQSGTAELTLSGDAAHAGTATHPTIMGKVVPIAATNPASSTKQSAAGVTQQAGGTAKSTDIAPVQLAKSLLTSIGLPEYKAAAVAPVLAICLGACVVGGLGYALYRLLARRRHSAQNKLITQKQGENHVA